MIKIGLIQGNGTDLVGGGSIQLEYDLWANNQSDIELTHYIKIDEKEEPSFHKKKTILNRELHNVQEFNYNQEMNNIKEMNYIIILTFPFINHSDYANEIAISYYKNLLENKKDTKIGVLCYDYKKEVVSNNIGFLDKELYKLADSIWINNKKNYLYQELEKYGITNFHLECPQFMSYNKEKWETYDKKNLNQLYFVGRSLEWKGYEDALSLKERLKKETNKEVNVSLSGYLYDDEEALSKIDLEKHNPYKDYYLDTNELHTTIQERTEVHGLFTPNSKHIKNVGFGLYLTNLPGYNNYFPEYALIDFVRNGTVVIVPEFYFTDKTHVLYNYKPKEIGFLTYNKNNIQELSDNITELQNNKELYNDYRLKAYKFMTSNFSANKKIREYLRILNEARL